MTNYKIHVRIDKHDQFWAVYDNVLSKLIINPTREDLKWAEFKSYNSTNICPICREENNITGRSILYPKNALRNTNKNGKKTKEWVCRKHGYNYYQKYNSDSQNNFEKLLRDRRTGNLKDSKHILADNCQELTCNTFGVDDLNKENDNYILSIDHSPIPKGVSILIGEKLTDLSEKIPQTEGRHYEPLYERWTFAGLDREWFKKFDVLICYCISEDGNTIERIYIFPKEEIIKTGIAIYKIVKRWFPWYENYRVKDEKILKKVNDIWILIIKKRRKEQ